MLPSGHEFGYIDWLRRRLPADRRVPVGIGDDAALVQFTGGRCLVTTDMLMEGVDFTFDSATPQQIGYKSLAVNLSDLAAMAAIPVAAVVAVALPRQHGFELGQGIQDGLQALAAEFDLALAGGDTNTWDGPLVLSITAFGEPTGTGPVLRSGARPGDWVLATGTFGGSIAGRHLDFTPRVREALVLHARCSLHAMIDVSDGLSADLGHILEESNVGAILDEQAIPISDAAAGLSDNRTPLEHALTDGEDFELLLTVAPDEAATLLACPPFATRLTRIGEIVSGSGLKLRTAAGDLRDIPARGWVHRFGE